MSSFSILRVLGVLGMGLSSLQRVVVLSVVAGVFGSLGKVSTSCVLGSYGMSSFSGSCGAGAVSFSVRATSCSHGFNSRTLDRGS